jgi:hypothetical protein
MYSWDAISESYLTWILPLLGGLLLQVPFESGGSMMTTVLHIAQWLGNPVVILISTMGNLRATGWGCKLFDRLTSDVCSPACHEDGNESCARLINSPAEANATTTSNAQHSPCPTTETAATDLRDSLYILGVLNQYDVVAGSCGDTLEDDFASYQVMHAVLLFALFSCDTADGTSATTADESAPARFGGHAPGQYHLVDRSSNLRQRRAQLASDLRDMRKRTVVPVLLSVFWHCVALMISISKAWDSDTSAPDNLVLGIFMCWLPALVVCAVVDRNPTSIRHTRRALQQFLDTAASAAAASAAITADSAATWRPAPRRPLAAAAAGNADAGAPEAAVGTTSDVSSTVISTAQLASAAPLHSHEQQPPLSPSSTVQSANEPPLPLAKPPRPLHRRPLPAPQVLEYCGHGRHGAYHRVATPILLYLKVRVAEGKRRCSACWQQTLSACSLSAISQAASAAKSSPNHHQQFLYKCLRLKTGDALATWFFFGVALSMAGFLTFENRIPCAMISNLCYFFLVTCCLALEAVRHEPKRRRGWLWREYPRRTNTTPTVAHVGDNAARRGGRIGMSTYVFCGLRISLELVSCMYLLLILLGKPIGMFNNCSCHNRHQLANGGGWYYAIVFGADNSLRHEESKSNVLVCLVVGCLPLLLVPYALYVWCTLSFLAAYDVDRAMRGLSRVQRWRYIERGEWLAPCARI